jgi:hypothetical protein
LLLILVGNTTAFVANIISVKPYNHPGRKTAFPNFFSDGKTEAALGFQSD